MAKTAKLVKNGSDLAEVLQLPVAEGRFHVDGHFFQRPGAYPCAFFDRRGYLIVDSEAALAKIARLSKQKVNFQRPVSTQKGYRFQENWPDWPMLANARTAEKAKLAEASTLLSRLSEEERRQLIARLSEK